MYWLAAIVGGMICYLAAGDFPWFLLIAVPFEALFVVLAVGSAYS